MIRTWWKRRRCMHGTPAGDSFVSRGQIVDPSRKLYECRTVLGGCGKRWVW